MISTRIQALVMRILLMAVVAAAGVAQAQDASSGNNQLGIWVTGQGRQTFVIAVPDFQPAGGGADQYKFAEIISNDLKQSGWFRMPDNPAFVRETNQVDLANNTINFADWRRIGALYLVKGTYEVRGSDLITKVFLYDTVSSAGFIKGRQYENYRTNESRALAHQISNDIVKQITGFSGVAGTKIVFIRANDRYGKSKQVSVMDCDGFGVRALTSQGTLTATPAWGMNGTEVYYTTYKDFNPDLAGMILSSGATWWISRRNGFNLSPAWSEKQQTLALTLTKDGNSEIYTMNREGKNLRRLTTNRAIDSSPCWSPDGTKIAFTSDRAGTGRPQIYIMDVSNPSDVRRITDGGYNDAATWSPDGTKIAYCSRIDGDFQIFTVNVDGTDRRQLTSGDNNEDPTWAPNSKLLAFTSDRSGSRQIYTMFAEDGSNVMQVTSGSPSQSAEWGPGLP